MNHRRPNRKIHYACIFMVCMSTSLQIQPFYLCCHNKKIQDEIVDPSITTMNNTQQDLVRSFNDLTQDDYSQCAPRRKPIPHKNLRRIVKRPPSIGMVAFGISRYRDENDSISK